MSTPSVPSWLSQLIAEEGESKPMDVFERESLLGALKAAHSPEILDPERHQRILERALHAEDPFAPPNEKELAEAAILRDHLDSNPLVMSLRSAQGSLSTNAELEPKIRERALAPKATVKRSPSMRRATTIWGALAVAASVALWLVAKSSGPLETFETSNSQRPLALSRSTESLFTKPFDTSSPSERIDKIAQVRERDLRHNRYAKWGLP